jgi:hypothetical protein
MTVMTFQETPLSGLIRQSMLLSKIHFSQMDARVEPAHDGARGS